MTYSTTSSCADFAVSNHLAAKATHYGTFDATFGFNRGCIDQNERYQSRGQCDDPHMSLLNRVRLP